MRRRVLWQWLSKWPTITFLLLLLLVPSQLQASVAQTSLAFTPSDSDSSILSASANGYNRVTNGDFEFPTVTWGVTYHAGQSFGYWTVESGSVDQLGGGYWQAASGTQSVDLSGWAGAGAIYQDLLTTPGQTYPLGFSMAGNPEGGPRTVQMEVWWGSTLLDTLSFDTTGRSNSNMGWASHQYTAVAIDSVTRLKFKSLTDEPYGPALDNVWVSSNTPPTYQSILLAPPMSETVNLDVTLFYSTTVIVNVSSGQIFLSSTTDSLGWLSTDDEVRIRVQHQDGSAATYTYVYGFPKHYNWVESTPRVDVTNLFEVGINTLTIELWNGGGPWGTVGYYLVGSDISQVGGEPNLTISHIEVTQAIQGEVNNVPLIADKPTEAPVYVDVGSSTLRIVSDSSWRVSATVAPGWETLGFDDSSWEFAVAPSPDPCVETNCAGDPSVFLIWSSGQDPTIYLRKTFSLPNAATIFPAILTSSCDDDHEIYVNGVLVVSDLNGIAGPVVKKDLHAYLRSGTNVIAIKAIDTFCCCRALCFDLTITTTPGAGVVNSILLAPSMVGYNSPYIPHVFYSNTVAINFSGGPVILSSTPDGLGDVSTDDEVRIQVGHPDGSVATYTHVYGEPSGCGSGVCPTPPVDVTNLFQVGTNTVTIELIDNLPCCYGTYGYYLVGQVSLASGFSISSIEVTQAIQDEANGVPLIANKPTFVRVYVDCGSACSSLPNVTGLLRGIGPSGELAGSPLSPINHSIIARHENWTNQRGDLAKSLNFILPPEWLAGTITLRAEVVSAVREETITLQPVKIIRLAHTPVTYVKFGCPVLVPDMTGVLAAHRFAQKVYPVADIVSYELPGITFRAPDYFPCSDLHSPLGGALWLYAERKLQIMLALHLTLAGGRDQSNPSYIIGWLPRNLFSGASSAGKLGGYTAVIDTGVDTSNETGIRNDPERVLAHEVAHLMGRGGINTADCPSSDALKDWPYNDAKIQDYGIDGYGFGWLSSSPSALKSPETTFDYMSYCPGDKRHTLEDVWTSSWTYTHIYSETLRVQAGALTTKPLSTPQPYFIASGLVYTDDTAILDPIWVITTTMTPENPPVDTSYCLEAQNFSGTALVSHCFALAFVNYETGQATNVDGFNLMFPYPGGIARIVLKKGDQELAIRLVTANLPNVTVLSPNGGEAWAASGAYTITWSATDTDGDQLSYSVLYSPDGSNWIPVETTITQTQLIVNATELAGGTAARVRILASDGVNTSADESDAPFTVGRKEPQAYILSPEAAITITVGTPLWLQGYAYDLEDGSLAGTSMRWLSNHDGELGTGAKVLTVLSLGQHTLTFAATDSNANTTTVTVRVLVTFPEDIVPDCQVNEVDIQAIVSRWNQPVLLPYDLDGDGQDTILDIMKVAAHWGENCP